MIKFTAGQGNRPISILKNPNKTPNLWIWSTLGSEKVFGKQLNGLARGKKTWLYVAEAEGLKFTLDVKIQMRLHKKKKWCGGQSLPFQKADKNKMHKNNERDVVRQRTEG